MRQNAHNSPGNIRQTDFAGADLCSVALISSQDLIAEGISQGLEQHNKINLQDRFNNYDDLLNSAQPARYEVALINARLIQYPLADFFQQIQNKSPNAKLVVFAAEADPQFLKSLMRVGVYGFVPMEASINELCDAILAVKSGHLWFDKSLLDAYEVMRLNTARWNALRGVMERGVMGP